MLAKDSPTPSKNEGMGHPGAADRIECPTRGISAEVLDAPEPAAAIQRAEDFGGREVVPLFDDIRLPVLILSGAQDPIITPRDAGEMHVRIPGSQLLVIEKAGHELYKDQPDVSANAILEFARQSNQRISCSSRRSAAEKLLSK